MFSRLFESYSLWYFKRNGWSISQHVPPSLKKYVLIVAPHTSNWDFPIGIAARKIMGLNVRYVAKKELFVWPVKSTLIKLGGYPIDRSKNNRLVDQVVDLFETVDDFAVCITPEGTRSKVNRWRSGFYHMATKASVPIVMVGFDYAKRIVKVSDPFHSTGNMEADFKEMHGFFRGITPKYPELAQYD